MKRTKKTIVGVSIVLLGLVSAFAQYPSGLASLWQGNGNLTDSVGTNNGIISPYEPPTMEYVPGIQGEAFKFNGGVVSVPDSASLAPAVLTVQAWVKGAAPGAYSYILNKSYGSGGISYAFYSGGDNTIYFFVYLAGGSYVLSPSGGASLWDNNWHQITGVFDGTTVHLFVDGVEAGSGTPTGTVNGIYYGAGPLIFGNYVLSGGFPYSGSLDEVKIFNVAQSAEEVMDTYTNASGSATTNGLVSWYKADGNASDSWGSNDGVAPANALFEYGDGRSGEALFPKLGCAIVSDAPNLDPSNVTLQAWVKSVSPAQYSYIACKSLANAGVSYALSIGSGYGVDFLVSLAQGGGSVVSPVVEPGKLWDGAWHLVSGVWDGNAAHVYLDGVEQGEVTTSANAANGIDYSTPEQFVIGDYKASGGLPFVGLMDDLQVYDRALLPAEIMDYYAAGSLVSWWAADYDTNSGAIYYALDSVGTNSGVLAGGASYGPSRSSVGDSYHTSGGLVNIPDSTSLKPENITIEAQINGVSPGTNKYLIAKSFTGTTASYALYTGPNGGLQFYISSNGANAAASPDAGTGI